MYTEKELVSFGNYLLSEERKDNLRNKDTNEVWHSDLENWKQQLRIGGVPDTLPADDLIKSLGEAKETNEYLLKTHNGVWWIEHKHVGSGKPLKQWLTDKPISG